MNFATYRTMMRNTSKPPKWHFWQKMEKSKLLDEKKSNKKRPVRFAFSHSLVRKMVSLRHIYAKFSPKKREKPSKAGHMAGSILFNLTYQK